MAWPGMYEWFMLDYGVARGTELPGCAGWRHMGDVAWGSVDDRQGTGASNISWVHTTAWTQGRTRYFTCAPGCQGQSSALFSLVPSFAAEMVKG